MLYVLLIVIIRHSGSKLFVVLKIWPFFKAIFERGCMCHMTMLKNHSPTWLHIFEQVTTANKDLIWFSSIIWLSSGNRAMKLTVNSVYSHMIFLGEAASTVSPNISNLFQTTLTFTSLPPATNQDQLTFALGSASCSLCKMDRALDEIVAERHVRSRIGCPFSLALQALTKGDLC